MLRGFCAVARGYPEKCVRFQVQHFDQIEVPRKEAPARHGERFPKRKGERVSAIIVLQGFLVELMAGEEKSGLGVVRLWVEEFHDTVLEIDE